MITHGMLLIVSVVTASTAQTLVSPLAMSRYTAAAALARSQITGSDVTPAPVPAPGKCACGGSGKSGDGIGPCVCRKDGSTCHCGLTAPVIPEPPAPESPGPRVVSSRAVGNPYSTLTQQYRGTYWSHPTDLYRHLRDDHMHHGFTAADLEGLTPTQLEALHALNHQGLVKPGGYAAAVGAPVPVDSPSDNRYVMFFHSTGCAPCEQMLRNVLQPMATDGWLVKDVSEGSPVNIQLVSWEKRSDLFSRLQVEATPTLLVIEKKKVIKRYTGVMSRAQVERLFSASLPHAAAMSPVKPATGSMHYSSPLSSVVSQRLQAHTARQQARISRAYADAEIRTTRPVRRGGLVNAINEFLWGAPFDPAATMQF